MQRIISQNLTFILDKKKNFQKIRIKENFINLLKVICEKERKVKERADLPKVIALAVLGTCRSPELLKHL